ncbi:MAG: amino acid adenylation domain-containing protein, partial [Psychrosphaera sp.]|nr:amino acid adenylation domain-containing protein [Psychrosphaera sp.]
MSERTWLFNQAKQSCAGNMINNQHLVSLLSAQVAKTPASIALICGEQQLSYQQLDQQANRLAALICTHYQGRHGHAVIADTLIGLYFDRSIDMVVSIIAVLKAGAAYVPLAPDAPRQRVEYMLADTGLVLLLSQRHYQQRLLQWTDSNVGVIAVDDPDILVSQSMIDVMPSASLEPASLAYVIYTSGTTGQPKGVMVEHQSIANLIINQTQALNFSEDEKVIWLPSYVFDASIETLFMALCNGAQLIVPQQAEFESAESIGAMIAKHQVTHLVGAASYLMSLGTLHSAGSLKRVISGGEMCPVELKQRWGKLLINQYGPTECTVTALQCLDFTAQASLRCIGKPIANVTVYVLDSHHNLVPVGTPGELCIGGAGLARGYLNNPALTQQKFIDFPFIDSPFSHDENAKQRLYKTGDTVRWLADGQLEYLSRNDAQVKIRGNRIELGEIEQQLSQLDGIAQALVTEVFHQGSAYLAAYVVTQKGGEFLPQQWQSQLALNLPDYMVPTSFTELDSIPLTINGKLDKRALPAPQRISQDQFVAPSNALELQLCAIWQQLLGVERVGIEDNFSVSV